MHTIIAIVQHITQYSDNWDYPENANLTVEYVTYSLTGKLSEMDMFGKFL